MGIRIICIGHILWRILTIELMFDDANILRKISVRDVPINNYELLNIETCSFHVVWNRGCPQSLVVSCKYWVVPLVSTRISGYSQVILLDPEEQTSVKILTVVQTFFYWRSILKCLLQCSGHFGWVWMSLANMLRTIPYCLHQCQWPLKFLTWRLFLASGSFVFHNITHELISW